MSAPDLNNMQLVLLDRDGVINFDSPDFIKNTGEWQPIPGALEAIAALQTRCAVAVCTNQSGVGRGLLDESTLAKIHDKLNASLTRVGGQPMDIYFCPHHPDDGCTCRKPAPGLLEVAMTAHGVDPLHTLYAGDSERDLLAAINARCAPALILTGHGKETLQSHTAQRTALVFEDLSALARALGGA